MLKIRKIPPAFITGKELESISASHTYFQGDSFWKASEFEAYLKNKNTKVWVATFYGRRLAFLVALENIDEIEIQFVATHRFFKNQGFAEALLAQLEKDTSETETKHIFLEVRASNEAAKSLYKKMRYEIAGCRKNYYKNPKEDAILMKRNLREKEA